MVVVYKIVAVVDVIVNKIVVVVDVNVNKIVVVVVVANEFFDSQETKV